MFLKNSMRPAFASASNNAQMHNRRTNNDAFTFDTAASETDDFGSFNSSASSNNNRAGTNKGKSSGGFKPSAIVIAIAAVVAVVLLMVLIVAIASGSSKDMKYANNTFVAFCDEDGIYRVAANGNVVGEYENEIELIPADDRSFAYVIENSDDGYRITITDGKDVTEITPSPVTKVLATAGLTPGVVWLDADNGIYLYTEKGGEERITRDVDATSANADENFFFISADASTVVYTKIDEDRPAELHHLCVYTDSSETKFQKNMYPVAVSDDGSMIYAYAYSKDSVTKTLYVLPFNDESDRYLLSNNFLGMVATNAEGNEVVFTTIGDTDSLISTYVVSFNLKKMDEVAQPVRIAKGAVYTPVAINNDVARFSTFEDTYFEAQIPELDIIDNQAPVYYVGKDYEVRRISKFAGKFDPDGDYFYYTNSEGTLQRVDLSDADAVSQKIAEDVVDFEITQKGNVYWLDDTTRLMYYSNSKEKKTRIADNVEGISMHTYSNTLYFTFTDSVNIYTTEEGSEKEAAKFDSGTVTGLPVFANPEYKKTFAAFYDMDNEEWRLFYTSNGKKFKHISVCSDIDGFDIPLTISDIIDSILPSIPESETSDTTAEE